MSGLDGYDGYDGYESSKVGGARQGGDGRAFVGAGITASREACFVAPASTPAERSAAVASGPFVSRKWLHLGSDGLPAMGRSDWLPRMDGWARSQVILADLLGGVSLKPGPSGFAVAHRGRSSPLICKIHRPGRAQFEAQLSLVDAWANARMERMPEVITQAESPYAYWGAIVNLHPEFSRSTIELMQNSLSFCSSVLQRMKFSLVCPRPTEYSARVQPVFTARGFFAYPSGHATEAFLIARLLCLLIGAQKGDALDQQLQLQAGRIATNRVVAGVHFPIDGIAGRVLGESLAEYLHFLAVGSGGWSSRDLDFAAGSGRGAGSAGDASGWDLDLNTSVDETFRSPFRLTVAAAETREDAAGAEQTPWQWLWQRASTERV